jgi:hypothetical protein
VASELQAAIDAPGDFAEVLRDSATMQESAVNQMTGAWESIVATMGTEAAPAFAELATAMAGFLSSTDAAESLATVFIALAEAGGLAIDGLVALNLIDKKTETPTQRLDKVRAERKQIESRQESISDQQAKLLDKKDLTPREVAKLGKLTDQFDKLQLQEVALSGEEQVLEDKTTRTAAEFTKVLTRESFTEQFAAAGDKSLRTKIVEAVGGDVNRAGMRTDEDVERERATGIIDTLRADPNARISGDNPEQEQLIQDLRDQITSARTGGGAEQEQALIATDEAQMALGNFTTMVGGAAKALADIQAQGRADIGG